jgi:hypothetical protein
MSNPLEIAHSGRFCPVCRPWLRPLSQPIEYYEYSDTWARHVQIWSQSLESAPLAPMRERGGREGDTSLLFQLPQLRSG